MDMPQLVSECAFASDPLATSPTWTDISNRSDGVTPRLASGVVARGRQYELDDFEAGTFQGTFNNIDGYLHPGYAAGPYFGNLVPNKQFRLSVVYGGVTYRLFKGYADGWTPRRNGGRYIGSLPFSATDLLGLFQDYPFPAHDDGRGGGAGRVQLGHWHHASNTFSQDQSLTGTDEAVRVYALVDATYYQTETKGPFVQDIVLKVTYTDGNGNTGNVAHLEIKHHVSRHPDHRWKRRLDLKLNGADTVHAITKVEWKHGKFHGKSMKVTFWGERPIVPRGTGDVQLVSALKRCGVPSSLVTTRHAGRFTQAPSSPWGEPLLQSVRLIGSSEMGQIYVNGSGQVVFEDRDWRYNNWGSPQTWHDGNGTGNYIFADCQPSEDNQHVTNIWQITRQAINAHDTTVMQQEHDKASMKANGHIVGQRQPTLQTDKQCRQMAGYLLKRTKDPRYRIPTLVIKPRSNPSVLFPAVLGMEVSDSIIVNEYPPNGSASSFLVSKQMNIEHIEHSFTPDDWTTTLQLSPRVTTKFRS